MKKNSIRTWIVRIVLCFVASVILGSAIYSLYAKCVKKEQLPMPFGIGTSIVLSGSMEPVLSVDDLVVVGKCKNYQVGDVVVFKGEHSYTIHRIIQIDGDTVVTQGDANNAPDAPISKSAIKGKLLFAVPGMADAINSIRSPIVLIILLTAIALCFVLCTDNGDKQTKNGLPDLLKQYD